jgi:large subunit ribosomal protein L23
MTANLNKYDVLVKPAITEKSTVLSAYNKVVFYVAQEATKPQVKNAVQDIFSVDVESVNIINLKGKVKRFRGRLGRRNNVKKAIVTIKEGQAIDITSGVK